MAPCLACPLDVNQLTFADIYRLFIDKVLSLLGPYYAIPTDGYDWGCLLSMAVIAVSAIRGIAFLQRGAFQN